MRESHRLMSAWELEEQAETEPDPIKALELRKQADQLRIDSLNAWEEAVEAGAYRADDMLRRNNRSWLCGDVR